MKIAKHVGAVLAVALLLAAGLATAGVRVATGQDPGPDDHQVTICHDVEGNGNTGNGYNIITVDKDSIASNPNGHDTHEGDLIPPFDAGFTVGPPPKQWNAYPGKGDYSLIGTNCAEPTTTSTTTGTETTTTETTTTETETTTTTTTPPPPPPPPGDRCPPGEVPTDGKDGEPGNEECEPPGGTTTTETTTTTTPPPTTTGPPTETTAPPETTTPPPTTAEPPVVKPPASKPKPPKKAQPKPKPKKPKMPPPCPPASTFEGVCAPMGSG